MAGLNETPSCERVQIALFGRRNAGKSSLLNALAGQDLAIVSETRGTTTDPVKKSMELLPLGPVTLIDTPGLDDEGALGALRVKKAREVLRKTDLALMVRDAAEPENEDDRAILREIRARGIPYLYVLNKADLHRPEAHENTEGKTKEDEGQLRGGADGKRFFVSCLTRQGIQELKDAMAGMLAAKDDRPLIRDLLSPGDVAVLVVPIDKAAPKGRLILPQQQTIRDILEAGAQALVTRDTELAGTLNALKQPPRMVVTDSQVFGKVDKIVPADVPLTSFSILMARYKGDLFGAVRGARAVKELKDGDPVLIAEGCTHHRQCGDIGTEKLPAWIRRFAGCEPAFSWVSGGEFPEDLGSYKLVVHCGGCMLNAREMQWRLGACRAAGVPATNYGTLIAYIHGILDRSVAIFEK